MTSLYKLLPKRSSFEVVFNDGRKRTLWLRPFTLRDEAYLREAYQGQELIDKMDSLDPRTIAQLLWRQLEPESKKIFEDVKVIDENDQPIENAEGYEKLMFSFGGIEQIMAANIALITARGLNSIVQDDYPKTEKKTFKTVLIKIIPSFLKR